MNEYELLLHPREQDFREIAQLFAKLLGLAAGIHEEIYSQHPIYLSYTSIFARDRDWSNDNRRNNYRSAIKPGCTDEVRHIGAKRRALQSLLQGTFSVACFRFRFKLVYRHLLKTEHPF